MPKKNPVAQNPDSLWRPAERIRAAHESLAGAVKIMRQGGLEVIHVPHFKSMMVGLDDVEKFTWQVQQALTEAHKNRGDFVGGEEIGAD